MQPDRQVTELRRRLRRAGYDPLPLDGKAPCLKEWQKQIDSNDDTIGLWGTLYPYSTNTGALTKRVPTLDLDILNPAAAEAAEELVRERFEERGCVLTRIGRAPKRAVLFRTDEPFAKIAVNLVAPNGGEERVEFLADGQQVACFGTHPVTKRPYAWHGGEPGQVSREDLPYIREADARQLVDEIVELLVSDYGYQRKAEARSAGTGNGKDHAEPGERERFDWGKFGGLLDHDNLVSVAMALIAGGLDMAATYNLLRSRVEAINAPDAERKQRRLDELRGIVDSAAGKGSGAQSNADWPRPKEIKPALLPIPAFDPELLPPALRDFVMDEAERMPCPPDYIAASLLSVLGSVIGARCFIMPKTRDPWSVPPNLWCMCVGEVSSFKTPAMNAATKPLDRMIADMKEAHHDKMEAFEHAKMVHDARLKALELDLKTAAKDGKAEAEAAAQKIKEHKNAAPKEPAERRFKTNDTTIEKLGELLRDSPAGVAVHRDEIVGLLASWERDGHESDRQFYLEAWNGNASHDVDRIGRGSIHIPNLCITILGGIQPDRLRAYQEMTENRLSNDGVLQRFQLLVYPDPCAWEYQDRSPRPEASDRVFRIIKELADFDPIMWGGEPTTVAAPTPAFRFDEAAQPIFIEFLTKLHRERINPADHPLVRQHLSKYPKLMPALALILHLAECADTGRRGRVTPKAAERAVRWCDYLEAHARRCYGLLLDGGATAAKMLSEKIMAGKLPDGFTFRTIDQAKWSGLTTKKAIEDALGWLEDSGWIRAIDEPVGKRGGRPTTRYAIHPDLPRATAEQAT